MKHIAKLSIYLNLFLREIFSHQNVTFNDNGTLSTTPKHPLEWQEHMSGGRREDDLVMMPNIALLVSIFIMIHINSRDKTFKFNFE